MLVALLALCASAADVYYEVALDVPNAAPAKGTTSSFFYELPAGTPNMASAKATLGDGSGAQFANVDCSIANATFQARFQAGPTLTAYPASIPAHVWCPVGSAAGTNHHVKVVLNKIAIDYVSTLASDTITLKNGAYRVTAYELPAGATYPLGTYACKKAGATWPGMRVQVVAPATGPKRYAWTGYGASAPAGTGTCDIPRTGTTPLVISRTLTRTP
jgi:hypothetical protein